MSRPRTPHFDCMVEVTLIEQTEISGRGLTVTTEQFHDHHALRPFRIFLINSATGHTQFCGDYTCAASAALRHEHVVRRLTTDPVFRGA